MLFRSTAGAYKLNDRLASANTVDGYIGRPMALQAQKFYFQETGSGSLGGITDANHPQQVLEMWQQGCIPILCFKPNRNFAVTDEFTLLQNAISTYQSAGVTTMVVVLWQECNDTDSGTGQPFFASAAAYQSYWNHYAPAVPASATVKLAYNPGSGQWANATGYYPGAGSVVPSVFEIGRAHV